MWRVFRRRVADDHVADDLLQETFLRIHRNVDKLHESDRLAAWVYRIARNVIHDHYRVKNGDLSLTDNDMAEENDGKDQRCVFQFDRQENVIYCDPKPDRTICRDCHDLELPPISGDS